MAKTVLQKEIDRLNRAERRFLKKQFYREPTKPDLLLAEKVPEKLESTLNAAFAKAFHLIFSKGSWLISKTYSEDKLVAEFEEAAAELEEFGEKKHMRIFKRRASVTGTAHTLVSAVAGLTMGIFGGMLPDIVLFNALVLRNIYQIAMKYGYSYDTDEERKFILRIIAASISEGDELIRANKEINQEIRTNLTSDNSTLDERINEAAIALARALLLMKFLQNIPVIGVVGGASDFIYMERISDYAVLKYQRRFLVDQLRYGRHE